MTTEARRTHNREYQRLRRQSPDVVACERAYNLLPEVKARRRSYRPSPDARAKKRSYTRDRAMLIRLHALEIYGASRCARCGEADTDVLELDHVNGGGTAHRKTLGTSSLYEGLRRAEWPTDTPLQVLCANCHARKTKEDWRARGD